MIPVLLRYNVIRFKRISVNDLNFVKNTPTKPKADLYTLYGRLRSKGTIK